MGPAFDAHPQPTWLLDGMDLAVLAANAAARRVFAPGGILSGLDGLYREEAPEALRRRLEAAGPGPDGISVVDWWLRADDGPARHVPLSVAPMQTDGRSLLLASAPFPVPTGDDARQQVERALKESEARFNLVVDLAPGAIMISRLADGMIMYVNRRIGGMFDMRPDEIIGTTTERFYADPADRERLIAEIRNNGAAENFETSLKRPDGRIFWIMAWARPITYREEPALLVVFNDITGT
ncbi:MAG TPA: PAS domain-containing protein, partial [Arenibaculum sp.]|nr:PAS domain-containing protein [Arenibaculum sp.]